MQTSACCSNNDWGMCAIHCAFWAGHVLSKKKGRSWARHKERIEQPVCLWGEKLSAGLSVCLSISLSLYASCLAFLGFWPVHKLSHLHYEWQWGELTRLLVFETHACDHTWKKDLQQCALAKALSLFIPPFPSAMGLFFFFSASTRFTQEMEEKGPGPGKRGTGLGSGWGRQLFSFFTSQVNPHYQDPWSLVSATFIHGVKERGIY